MQAVIFCGLQASGKTTFYRQRFFDTHVRISLDMLRTRHRERLFLRTCLEAKQPFVVDNTNPTAAERAAYIAAAKSAGFRVIGYYFHCDVAAALARNAGRPQATRVPKPGIFGTRKRLQLPSLREGFEELYFVRIDDAGRFVVEQTQGELPAGFVTQRPPESV